MQALDGIGRIDDFADLLLDKQKRGSLAPRGAANSGRWQAALSPQGLSAKSSSRLAAISAVWSFMDLLELSGDRLTLLPVAEAQGIAD